MNDTEFALQKIYEHAQVTKNALKEAEKQSGYASMFARSAALSEFFGYASYFAESVVSKPIKEGQ